MGTRVSLMRAPISFTRDRISLTRSSFSPMRERISLTRSSFSLMRERISLVNDRVTPMGTRISEKDARISEKDLLLAFDGVRLGAMNSSFEHISLSMSERDRGLRVMGTRLALVRSRLSERGTRLALKRWRLGPSEHRLVEKRTRVGDKAIAIKGKGRPMTVVVAGLRSTRGSVGDNQDPPRLDGDSDPQRLAWFPLAGLSSGRVWSPEAT
jgi:hypothetical protein